MFMAGGAVVTGVALMPREAQAASLLDTLKDMGKPGPAALEADLPAIGAQQVQFRRRRVRRCVTRVGPRGRIRRICGI